MTRSRRLGDDTSSGNGCPGQEQSCIYFREGADGSDQLLIDPAERGTGPYTAVKPLRVSPDGRLLLYEVKEGGERTGTFEILDIDTRAVLPDVLPRGYLRGFAFSPDSKSFYYVHEPLTANRPHYRAAYHHVLGTSFDDDEEIFFAGEDPQLRLQIVPGMARLGFLILRFRREDSDGLLAVVHGRCQRSRTDHQACGVQIRAPVASETDGSWRLPIGMQRTFGSYEVRPWRDQEPEFVDVVPESDAVIQNWAVAGEQIFVSYVRKLKTEIVIFDSGWQTARHPAA